MKVSLKRFIYFVSMGCFLFIFNKSRDNICKNYEFPYGILMSLDKNFGDIIIFMSAIFVCVISLIISRIEN